MHACKASLWYVYFTGIMVKNKIDNIESSLSRSYPVSIGRIIEAELRRQERTVTWLSRKINCDRRNIYDIFGRDSIDTMLLFRLSKVLHVDFFEIYSQALADPINGDYLPVGGD